MNRISRMTTSAAVLILAVLFSEISSSPSVLAQVNKSKSKPAKPISPAEIKQIDQRLEKLNETLNVESNAIIDDYDRAGQYERAKQILEAILKLDPKNEVAKKKIAEFDEKILDRTEYDRRFDVASDWTLVGNVQKDKPARVEATGDYRMNLTVPSLGPDGFPAEDVMRDLVSRVPTGALMGMILTDENRKEKKPGEPFAIKSKLEFTPRQSGMLYLKVNIPPGSKCNGDLKLKLSGIGRAN